MRLPFYPYSTRRESANLLNLGLLFPPQFLKPQFKLLEPFVFNLSNWLAFCFEHLSFLLLLFVPAAYVANLHWSRRERGAILNITT